VTGETGKFVPDEQSPYYRLGALAMTARLYLYFGDPRDKEKLERLVEAEIGPPSEGLRSR